MEYLVIEAERHHLRLYRFDRKGRKISFLEYSEVAATEPHALAAELARDAAGRPRPDRIILAPTPRHFFSREIALPLQDRRKVRQILPLELKGATACDTAELAFEAVPAGEGKVLALWMRKKELLSLLGVLSEGGLDPQVVSPSPAAWGTLLPSDDAAAVTDGSVVALFRERRLLRLHAVDPSDVVADIRRTCAAFELTLDLPPVPLRRIGSFPGGEELEPLPLTADAAGAFDDADQFHAAAGAFALVSADAAGEGINFRHGDLAYAGDTAANRKKIRFSVALAAVFVLLLAADAGIRYYLVRKDLASLDAAVSSIYRDIFPNRRKGPDPVGEVKAELRRLSAVSGGKSRVLSVLKGGAEVKGDAIPGFYEVEIEGAQVKLKGDAPSLQAVNELKSRLASKFTAVDIAETKSRADGGVTFTIRAALEAK